MEVLLLNKLANTVLVLLVPYAVLLALQIYLSVYLGVWANVILVTTWVVGSFLIWRPPRARR